MSDLFISIEQAETDLLSCAAFMAERIKSSDGHAEAMKAILPRYLAAGKVDLAAELANAVDDPFSRDRLLTLVAEKCAELDDEEYALQLADAIDDLGLQAQALERVALALAAKGHLDKATQIAAGLDHPDFVLAGVAVRQAADGDMTGSGETLDSIAFASARVSALQQIASAQLESEDDSGAATAAATLDRAAEDAGEIDQDEEKIRALCEIANLFMTAKRKDRAIETFETARSLAEVLDNVHRDYFLATCALGFMQAGSNELSDRTLDLITDKTHMASALLGIAREQWRGGEKETAIETLDEAHEIVRSQRDIETRDSRSRNALLGSIAAQFAGFGNTDKAVEVAEENQDIDEQLGALSQIAQILTAQREDELARGVIESISDEATRLFALVGMADSKERLGEPDAAMAVLDEAAADAGTVPQFAARSSLMNELAIRFRGHGRTEKAREVSLANLTLIQQIKDESSSAVSLANLCDVYTGPEMELGETERHKLKLIVASR